MEKIYGNVDEELKILEEQEKEKTNKYYNIKNKFLNSDSESVHVVFPFQHALLDLAEERIECLLSHLSGIVDKTNPTLEPCIPCNDCTLSRTSSKAIGNVLNELMTIYHNTMKNFIDALFSFFSNLFNYENLEPSQILTLLILNFKQIDHNVDVTQLFQSVEFDEYKHYDKVCNEKMNTDRFNESTKCL